jgi:uncharacterized protein (TIGR02246 family)
MRSVPVSFLALSAALLCLAPRPARGQGAAGAAEDKEAIAKNAEAFVEAFHRGDAKALADFWTPGGDYTTVHGHHLKGRKAIAKVYAGFFAENKGLKLRVDSQSLRFITPDVAVEDGMTSVIAPDGGPPSRSRYTIVHVKKDGQWHLASVREAAYSPPTNYNHLRGLEWLVGEWAGEEAGGTERLSFAWADNQNFLVASFATTHKNVSVAAATVWTGWDPVARHVRSWIFDADGGYGGGSWAHDGNRWLLKTNSVRRGAKKAATTFVLTRVDDDTLTLQARDRSLDGNALPDTKAVTLKRVK